MQAVILAGGLGTRLQKILNGKPKCLAPIKGNTILGYQLNALQVSNIKKVLIICFYKSELVQQYISSIKHTLNLEISIYVENEAGGTGGSIYKASKFLDDKFILVMGDLFFSINLEKIFRYGNSLNSKALIVCKFTDHPHDSDLIGIGEKKVLKKFYLRDKDRSQPMNKKVPPLGNSGIFYFKKEFILNNCTNHCDIHEVIDNFLNSKKSISNSINYFYTSEFIKDIGSESRLEKISKLNLIPSQINSKIRYPAIFLDKDDTLIPDTNTKNPRNIKINLFKPGIIKILKKYTKTHRIFITTNQPGISKGFFNEEDLINHLYKLAFALFEKGINISDFYFCPHHPKKGFKNEIKSLKIICDCRKPKLGMVREICNEFNTDLKKSIVIGDSLRDKKMAKNIGIEFINASKIN